MSTSDFDFLIFNTASRAFCICGHAHIKSSPFFCSLNPFFLSEPPGNSRFFPLKPFEFNKTPLFISSAFLHEPPYIIFPSVALSSCRSPAPPLILHNEKMSIKKRKSVHWRSYFCHALLQLRRAAPRFIRPPVTLGSYRRLTRL